MNLVTFAITNGINRMRAYIRQLILRTCVCRFYPIQPLINNFLKLSIRLCADFYLEYISVLRVCWRDLELH